MKFKLPLILLSGSLLLGCSQTPGGNGDESSQTDKTLIMISVSNPTKSAFVVGETISLSGMVVTAYYGDGTSEVIDLSKCTVDVPSTSSEGTKYITVTYNGKTATVAIYITKSEEKTLTGISVSGPSKTSYEVNETISLSGMVVTANYSDGTSETIDASKCTVDVPSTSTAGTKVITVTYQGKSDSVVIYVTDSGGDTPVDLDDFVAIAEAPEGVTLTDWTQDMRDIFTTYLAGIVPPFFYLDELRVTYDNLDILQVRGVAYDGVLQAYEDFLNSQQGYQAYTDGDNAGRSHVYGRALSMDLVPILISIDAMVGNGYITINFDKDIAQSNWPSEGIADLCREEYESIYTIPAYEGTGVSYIIEENILAELNILCLGAPRSSVSEYKTILENNNYQVKEMDTAGMYTALSRDSKIIIVFYYDGYGLMIMTTHGEGEKYTSWDDCLWAIDDFAKNELRHPETISGLIPAIPDAGSYEINRSIANGRLEIVAHKDSSFSQRDLNLYRNACSQAGYDVDDIKDSERIWILPKDKSYAMFVTLNDYISDLGDVWSDFALDICDYRLYEGYNVKYGEWPILQVNTINNNINPDAIIPGYIKDDAVYYVKSDLRQHIEMDLVNPGSSCLTDYKAGLEEYGYNVTISDDVYTAVDSTKSIKITFYMKGEEMHIAIDKFVEDTSTATDALITFMDKSNVVAADTYWKSVTWANGSATFTIDMDKSNYYVGNYGDYYFNPLRVYKNQKISISAKDKQLTKIEFTVVDVVSGNGSAVKDFAKTNLVDLSIEGLTKESYNETTGVVTYTVNSGYESGVEFVASLGNFGLKNVKIFYK